MDKQPLHIASCSFGKDSIATILLALEHNEPLDRVVFAEVMFDHSRGISGEIPEHIEWIYKIAIPRLESMGVQVDVVRAKRDYLECFFYVEGNKSKHPGKLRGFPLGGKCSINRDCKIDPIHKYYRQFKDRQIIQYVGIAADETKRLARLKPGTISLLDKYHFTEADSMNLCRRYDLVSPLYAMSCRGGCWFCPNARMGSLQGFRKAHPDLWDELRRCSETPDLISYGYKYGKTFQEINSILDLRESQLSLFD